MSLPPQTAASEAPERMVTCPNCGGPSVYAARNPYRPFCSQRCKIGDLSHWASETFRVQTNPSEDTNNPQ